MTPFLKFWLPVLLWMAVIFSASSDRMSFTRSSRLLEPLLRGLFPGISARSIHTIQVGVRKAAHMGEYAVLSLLVWHAIRGRFPRRAGEWHWPTAAGTLLLVMLYAASDEFHQSFVPSRQGTVTDVVIDVAGSVLVLMVVWWLTHRRAARAGPAPGSVPASS